MSLPSSQPLPEPDDWVRAIERELTKCSRSRFYGRLTVEMLDGRIVRVEVVKSIKDPRALSAVADSAD